MDSPHERLVNCFTAVFSGLPAEQAPTATVDTIASWDSTNHFMLKQVIEESFGIEIPEEVIGEVDSFSGFANYLESVRQSS
jgi:acyl carrier protein